MTTLETLILGLPTLKDSHNPTTAPYLLLKQLARVEAGRLFTSPAAEKKPFGPFGELALPYYKMGAIDSVDLFGLDELIIFSFYWLNRNRYKKVLDIGGNLGLHSIVMSRCGYDVTVYEPDPVHYDKLVENLKLNQCKNVKPVKAAVSTQEGKAQFVRVLGNTTSSHLKGSKNPYGDLETFDVEVKNIHALLPGVDLIKMDVEGHEKEIILSTTADEWKSVDAMIEVGTEANAEAIFNHLKKLKVNAFAQKKGWQKVNTLEDMPKSHRDGSLFISCKNAMPWDASV